MAHVQEFLLHSICHPGVKNDYNGVMRGPYLNRGDTVKVTALRKIVRTPSKFLTT